jgi:hypothetical protein
MLEFFFSEPGGLVYGFIQFEFLRQNSKRKRGGPHMNVKRLGMDDISGDYSDLTLIEDDVFQNLR